MRSGTESLREGSKLDLKRIVEVAFDVLDASGLDGLTLRAVADRLEVQSPALYWHVRNRAALLSHMARVLMQPRAGRDSVMPWWDRLAASARHLRGSLLRHRDAARLCLAAHPVGRPEESAALIAAPLVASGLDARTAVSHQAAVIAYTVGWVAYQQSPGMHEFLTQMIDFDESFESGLTAMVGGFRARL